MSDGTHHSLEVVGGTDTTGEHTDGKHRETWLPVELERTINRTYTMRISREETPSSTARSVPFSTGASTRPQQLLRKPAMATIDASRRTISAVAGRITCLSRRGGEGISPRIVMALGG